MIYATVSGNVGGDAELKNVGGHEVLNFSVAADSGFGDRKTTIWFGCAIWGARGAKLQQYIRKGSKVTVIGELSQREYNGKTYLELRVADIKLQDSQGGQGMPSPAPVAQQQAPAAPAPATQAPAASSGTPNFGAFDDDIPFAPLHSRYA